PESAGGWTPEIEVIEGDKEFTVRAEIPGLDPKDIKVSVTGKCLTLSGEKKEESEEKKSGYYHSERRYGSFHRSIELPAGTKPDAISAEYDKGVLTLKIGKAEEASSQRIRIKRISDGGETSRPKKTP